MPSKSTPDFLERLHAAAFMGESRPGVGVAHDTWTIYPRANGSVVLESSEFHGTAFTPGCIRSMANRMLRAAQIASIPNIADIFAARARGDLELMKRAWRAHGLPWDDQPLPPRARAKRTH